MQSSRLFCGLEDNVMHDQVDAALGPLAPAYKTRTFSMIVKEAQYSFLSFRLNRVIIFYSRNRRSR